MIEIEIDGKKLEAAPGSMIIEVADNAGIAIPRFCYHKKLSIAANCRMCLIEVEKAPKPLPACATPVTPGMKVFTNSVKAIDAQKSVMEFLLINHPLDCPICDQGGACELQDVSMGYGQDFSRYDEPKRAVADEDLGTLIATDMTRCIQCTRCVRFGQEIAGVRELGVLGRHDREEIGTFLKGQTLKSELSGNIIDLCPVGALTSKPFRFTARAWELDQASSIAPHDCVGSNIYLQTRGGKVMRVVPRDNEQVNENWISDRDRFSYQGLYSHDRLLKPMIKEQGQWKETDWANALDFAAKQLRNMKEVYGGQEMAGFASPNSTLEEFYLFQKILRGLGSQNIDHRIHQTDVSDQLHMPLYPALGISIEELEKQDLIVIVGSNMMNEAPMLAHRVRKASLQGAKIVNIEFAELAKHNLYENDFKGAAKKIILLGALAHNHPDASAIRAAAYKLAEKNNATLGFITEGANTSGAWLAGCIPHRKPNGENCSLPGLSFVEAIQAKLRAYVLLNIEPQHDCVHAEQVLDALRNAECVIALSAYQSPELLATATVLLPISPYAETSGTYVNIEGRFQSFNSVSPSLGESRPAWKILRVLGNLFQLPEFNYVNTDEVLKEINLILDKKHPHILSQFHEVKPLRETTANIPTWSIYNTDPIVRRGTALQAREL